MCVFAEVEGLSGPRSCADGWVDPDLSAASAWCERTVFGHLTEGAG